MCNVESVSSTCNGPLLGGQRAQCQLGTRFDCGNRQVGMTGFGIGSCSALRPHLGAKQTLEGVRCERPKMVRVLIGRFGRSSIQKLPVGSRPNCGHTDLRPVAAVVSATWLTQKRTLHQTRGDG